MRRFERLDHLRGDEGLPGRQLVMVLGCGGQLGHEHPQVPLQTEHDRRQLVGGVEIGSHDPEQCLRFIDIAVGTGQHRVLRDPAPVQKTCGSVVARPGVDAHGEGYWRLDERR